MTRRFAPLRADAHPVAVEDGHLLPLDRAGEGEVGDPVGGGVKRGGPGAGEPLRSRRGAQAIGALHRHIDGLRRLLHQAGFGQRLNEAALHVGRPAIAARPAGDGAPFELRRIKAMCVEARDGGGCRTGMVDEDAGGGRGVGRFAHRPG
ncbi:hypothetical protein ASG67_10340 [Sphingomonas sp. Leaf339]|uniref:hypothetical protein n=1 Tax=Sphingomonas sp. Leaf339 TaxID=1736343 RepID=UPI0006FE08F5|nr:hypothetical protein [Sphingomonas sp. Leaf339]KQU53202.1 hypothetical protein ASG67_10340 [Sphingomonas sp. Leaf339]